MLSRLSLNGDIPRDSSSTHIQGVNVIGKEDHAPANAGAEAIADCFRPVSERNYNRPMGTM